MTERNWAWEAKQLLPHLAGMLGNGVTVQAGGGSMVAHALNSTTWHTGTLAEAQAPWAVTTTVYDAHVANVNAHHNKQHVLSDSAVHSGLLLWAQLNKGGSSLADLETRSYTHLQGAGALYDVVAWSSTDTITKLTPSADVSAGTSALLRSSGGVLGLLGITSIANITMGPLTAVLPTGSILKDLGDYNRKWRSLYAAELYVETLVAQDVLATIGGRIMVAPTTKLIADLAAGGSTIDVEHNNLTSAFVYMASAPGGMAQVEVMKCGATATPITGGYRYTVTRNLDASGANAWVAGDAIANIGAVAGQGWIELTSTNTARNHLGPTIAIYARTGTAAWTDVKPVAALGNLRSFVDYAADQYGFALGNDLALLPTTGFSGITGDRTNGLRLFNTDIELYASGARFAWVDTTDGFTIVPSNDWQELRAYSFSNGTTTWGGMFAKEDISTFRSIRIQNVGSAPGKQYEIIVLAQGENANGPASVLVQALGGGASNYSATLSLTADIANNNKGYAYLQAGFTTLALDGATNVATLTAGTLALSAGVISSQVGLVGILNHGGSQWVYVNDPAGNSMLSLGLPRTVDNPSYIDLYSAVGTGINARWIRWGGANGEMDLQNYGTGNLKIGQVNAGNIGFYTQNAYRAYIMYTGEINSLYGYQRNGVNGSILVFIPPFNLADVNGATWGNITKAAGTYYFDVQNNGNGLPAAARGVLVWVSGKWSGANTGYYCALYQNGSGTHVGNIRAYAGGISMDAQISVPLDANGQFKAVVAGAVSMTEGYIRIIGYYI